MEIDETTSAADPEMLELNRLLMDFVRMTGLLQPDRVRPGDELSMSQEFALSILDNASAPLTQRDTAALLQLDKSTVSRLVSVLEDRGLLVRERDPDNHRVWQLRLTVLGRAAAARVDASYFRSHAHLLDQMSSAERQALAVGLRALLRSVDSLRAAPAAPTSGPAAH